MKNKQNDWRNTLEQIRNANDDLKLTQEETEQIKQSENKQTLSVFTNIRKGKTSTIISGWTNSEIQEKISKEIKEKLGVGGSTRGDETLIQGNKKDEIEKYLRNAGHTVL